jgi:hypothetical protein
VEVEERRIRLAWEGRISGCQLGKSLEPLVSMIDGLAAVRAYSLDADALPLQAC